LNPASAHRAAGQPVPNYSVFERSGIRFA
jgi:hypothetical protein